MKHTVSASRSHSSLPTLLYAFATSTQAGQLILLFLSLACCGSIVGLSRLLPHLATHTFHTSHPSTVLYFVVIFGGSKACLNLLSAHWASFSNRQYLLMMGWFLSFQSPFLITYATSWNQCLCATLFLGASQGILTSMCVIMIMDRVSAEYRGIANGILECTIYVCLACCTFLAALIEERVGYRPWICYASMLVSVIGLLFSLAIEDTTQLVKMEGERLSEAENDLSDREAQQHLTTDSIVAAPISPSSSKRTTLLVTLRRCASDGHVSALILSGFANNFKDGVAWGCFPIFFHKQQVPLKTASYLLFSYPFIWGIGQLFTGTLSDQWGRKQLIVGGLLCQCMALACMYITPNAYPPPPAPSAISTTSSPYLLFLVSCILLGVGTAMCYPVLQASLSDSVRPQYRASTLGVYRLCRDGGYVFGGILSGWVADRFSIHSVIGILSAFLLCCTLFAHKRLITRKRVTTTKPVRYNGVA